MLNEKAVYNERTRRRRIRSDYWLWMTEFFGALNAAFVAAAFCAAAFVRG